MSAQPVACQQHVSVTAAAQSMRNLDVGSLLVLDRDQLVGILTDRDIVVRCVAEERDPSGVTAGDICTHNVTSILVTDSIDQARNLMKRDGLRRLAVVDDDRRVTGIISFDDLAEH